LKPRLKPAYLSPIPPIATLCRKHTTPHHSGNRVTSAYPLLRACVGESSASEASEGSCVGRRTRHRSLETAIQGTAWNGNSRKVGSRILHTSSTVRYYASLWTYIVQCLCGVRVALVRYARTRIRGRRPAGRTIGVPVGIPWGGAGTGNRGVAVEGATCSAKFQGYRRLGYVH